VISDVMARISEDEMKRWIVAGATALCLGAGAMLAKFALDVAATESSMVDPIERGRYLVKIGGCNDCHTPGYRSSGGNVSEARWLIGDSIGFRGPWGTTYPSNLRRLLAAMDEKSWVTYARNIKARPPMPWFNLRAFTEKDLNAIYRYIRFLPADDHAVPDYVPPERQPVTPHIVMVPQAPKP
jgi:mono/diheme cytochrome c family protein